jgi:hypothetical protein
MKKGIKSLNRLCSLTKVSARAFGILSIVVLLVMGGGALTGSVTARSGADVVNVAASDLSGSGTASNPYTITNASELQAMEDDLDAHYVLGNDIDASETDDWNNGLGFDPVGNDSEDFTGHLDGNQHTIDQLTINRSAAEDVGLFGEVGENATIESVYLADIEIYGYSNVGSLVGQLEGSVIREISASGSVNGPLDTGGLVGDVERGSIVQNASMIGTVSGSDNIGGLVGSNIGGVVTRSFSRATVTATGKERGGQFARAGGLVGGNYNGARINKSYATGSVDGGRAGGITGEIFNSSRVADAYAAGSVNGTQSSTGGVVGGNFRSSRVIDSYWDKQATMQETSAGDAEGLRTTQMTGDAARTNMAGLTFGDVWRTQADEYPVLTWQLDNDGGSNAAPVATFGYSPTDPTSGTTVTFDASASADADGAIQTYEWDVDDDDSYEKTGQTVTHVFPSSGDQTVTLRVTDDAGATAMTSQTVPVSDGGSSLPSSLQRFDTNVQAGIQADEIVDAIVAYNNGEQIGSQPVQDGDIVDLIVEYNN